MFWVVGDEHYRYLGRFRLAFHLTNDVDAVGVVAIELAIDKYEVEFCVL